MPPLQSTRACSIKKVWWKRLCNKKVCLIKLCRSCLIKLSQKKLLRRKASYPGPSWKWLKNRLWPKTKKPNVKVKFTVRHLRSSSRSKCFLLPTWSSKMRVFKKRLSWMRATLKNWVLETQNLRSFTTKNVARNTGTVEARWISKVLLATLYPLATHLKSIATFISIQITLVSTQEAFTRRIVDLWTSTRQCSTAEETLLSTRTLTSSPRVFSPIKVQPLK